MNADDPKYGKLLEDACNIVRKYMDKLVARLPDYIKMIQMRDPAILFQKIGDYFGELGFLASSPKWDCLRCFANNTGVDQPAHPRRPISAFVIHLSKSFISRLATIEISIF